LEEFKSVRKFKIFNTNNLWLNLPALKRVMEAENLDLEIIINQKSLDDGQPIIQLETAAGAAIKHFKGAHGVNVPRSRFLPVKSCSDLLLIKSDIYSLEHGQLVINPSRMFENTPVIKLGDHFKKVSLSCLAPRQFLTFFFISAQIQQFQKRFKKIPKILELDHLTVTGDVNFGRNVTLRGTVIIVANEGQRIDIPDGCVLENRLLSGNLNMIVRVSSLLSTLLFLKRGHLTHRTYNRFWCHVRVAKELTGDRKKQSANQRIKAKEPGLSQEKHPLYHTRVSCLSVSRR
jgi:UTP--glucose-1-phosphate uridylyltransferase